MELQDMNATYKQVPETEYQHEYATVKEDALNEHPQEHNATAKEEALAEPQHGRRWTQHLAAILATLGSVSVGAVDGWTANAVPWLHDGNHTFIDNVTNPDTGGGGGGGGLTDEEASWLGSLVAMGAIVGSPPAGIMADTLGRKVVLLFMAVPYLVSWATIAITETSLPILYTSRFIAGLAMGIVSVVIPLYNEEISEVSVRGALGVYHNLMVTVGILFSYIVGAYVSYLWMAVIPCIIPITMLLTFVWVPESPVYLLAKERVLEAEAALKWLRGPNIDIRPEMARLQSMLDDSKARSEHQTALQMIRRILTNVSWSNYKAVVIVFTLMILRQLSGINAIVFYTVDIFEDANTTLSSTSDAMIFGGVEVIATYCSSLLVDKTGRRVLLLFSGVGTSICHATLAGYFFLLDHDYDLSNYSWIPLVMLAVFIIIFASGFGPLPWFMMAELIPTEDKGWATGMTGFLNWLFMFIVIKMFTGMNTQLGEAFTFGIFSINCVLATTFVALCVPETNGKTLEEIQREIRGE